MTTRWVYVARPWDPDPASDSSSPEGGPPPNLAIQLSSCASLWSRHLFRALPPGICWGSLCLVRLMLVWGGTQPCPHPLALQTPGHRWLLCAIGRGPRRVSSNLPVGCKHPWLSCRSSMPSYKSAGPGFVVALYTSDSPSHVLSELRQELGNLIGTLTPDCHL